MTVALSLALAACHDRSPPPSEHTTPTNTPRAAPSVATSSSPSSATAPAPSGMDRATDAELIARVKTLFAGYVDGSDFSFLRSACASPVERFITMKNADIGAVVTSAQHFFADKRGLSYSPDVKAMQVSRDERGDVVRVPVTMVWGTLPPRDWNSDDPGSRIEPTRTTLPEAGGGLWDGLVEHTTTVGVELAFDRSGRLTRYLEGAPQRRKLRFHADWACLDTFGFATALADGEVVVDLGDVFITETSPKGPQIARHVRLHGSDDAWVQDTRSYAVDNGGGGTSAGSSQCLVPVDAGDAGR